MLVRRIVLVILAFFCLCVLTACASPLKFHVNVSSLNNGVPLLGKNYVLVPGNKGVATTDLQFKEFAAYIRKVLGKQSYAETDSLNEADIAIFLEYGIGAPKREYYSYALPIFGQTGGGTSTFSANTFGSGGSSTTTGSVYSAPTFGMVGSLPVSGSYDVYHRYLILEAVDLSVYRNTNQIAPIWITTTTSSGASGDLRFVFPVLVAASEPYIATNTGKQVTVELSENDDRVMSIRGPTGNK